MGEKKRLARRKKRMAAIVLTTEEKYEKVKNLEHSTKCLLRDKERAKIYDKISKLYASLEDYEDSQERSAVCAKKAAEYLEKYQKQEKEKHVSEEQTKQVEKTVDKLRIRMVVLGIILLLIVAAAGGAVFLNTKPGRYARADFYEGWGNYKKSYLMFKNLEDYKDSVARSKECYYEYAGQCAKKNDLKTAKNVYRELADYKDSETKLTEVEIANIKAQPVGAEVLYGEYRWLILEKKGNKVFLLKSVPVNGIAYNDNIDKKTPTTWENSSVRAYLNSTFIKDTFSESAQKHIKTTTLEFSDEENKKGSQIFKVEDSLFLLNAEQAERYKEIHMNYKRDWWLIDPGANQNTAQFISYGELMAYGYDVKDTHINIRPAMWITLD